MKWATVPIVKNYYGKVLEDLKPEDGNSLLQVIYDQWHAFMEQGKPKHLHIACGYETVGWKGSPVMIVPEIRSIRRCNSAFSINNADHEQIAKPELDKSVVYTWVAGLLRLHLGSSAAGHGEVKQEPIELRRVTANETFQVAQGDIVELGDNRVLLDVNEVRPDKPGTSGRVSFRLDRRANFNLGRRNVRIRRSELIGDGRVCELRWIRIYEFGGRPAAELQLVCVH